MHIQPTSNLSLALIYRDRLLSALGVCRPAIRLCPAHVAVVAAHRWVPPTLKTQPDSRMSDQIVPAEWPYADPLSAPPADMPYQPHVIPPKEIHRCSLGDTSRSPTDVRGRWLDLYA